MLRRRRITAPSSIDNNNNKRPSKEEPQKIIPPSEIESSSSSTSPSSSAPGTPDENEHADSSSRLPSKPSTNGSKTKPRRRASTRLCCRRRGRPAPWGCLDTCYWLIGCVCFAWWLLLVLYKSLLPSLSEAISGPLPDPPGVALRKQGVRARHPVVFVPGTVTGGLELWEGHPCAHGLFRKRLWGGTFGEVYKRPLCWLEHMALDNRTGLDPPGVRVRPVPGLVAADYFAPGYFVWAVLIENLAKLGYEEKSMHMAAYDWRLAFQNTEVRDKTLSRLKSTIELLVGTNEGLKVVVTAHSMGALYFLHFMKWVEAPLPMGGGGGSDWCAKHIKAVMNIGGPLLGVPKAVSGLFSCEAKDIAMARAAAPGVMESDILGLHTLQHIMQVTRTWDSTMSMIIKGGDTVWGGLDWSPEEGYDCVSKKEQGDGAAHEEKNGLYTKELGQHGKPMPHYGRILSFGKDVAESPANEIHRLMLQDVRQGAPICSNVSCGDVWTEYHDLSWESVQAVEEQKVYTASSLPKLLRFVAPQMMERGDAHFSQGLADDVSDSKYEHFKYWANPLETRLPNAPEMEIYCMYGVGILTERSYIYKVSPNAEQGHLPFRIDTAADGDSEGCLKGGVQFVDGDETVPALSGGFMCAKGWRGRTQFNPSGAATFVREYKHAPPANLLEGRGTESASHVDIMGNFDLIHDILRVAAGASGDDLGGDAIVSDLLKWSERIHIKL